VKEVLRTNDIVLLSALSAELRARGIEPLELDAFTAVAEGSLGILPRRLMVADDDAARARRIRDDFQAAHE
jgi:hypothetical protein